MTPREREDFDTHLRARCIESFELTERCLTRSRSCLKASYARLVANAQTMTKSSAMLAPPARPEPPRDSEDVPSETRVASAVAGR